MGVKNLISNVFQHKKPSAPMSHAEFEQLGTSMRKLAKVAKEERQRAGGDPDAGKDTHFCRSGKTTLAAPGDIGKASQRHNTMVLQRMTAYLLQQLKNGRFTANQVERALEGLPREAGKSFDVVNLADQFDGILSVIDPEPLKRLSADTSASASAARKSLEKLEKGCPSDGDAVRFDETARRTDTECQRAINTLEHALTQATDCGDKFTTACGWNSENFNLDNSQKLREWFNGMFQQIPAAHSLKAISLPQDLLVAKFDYVTELKDSLELLLSQREERGHEPEFHDEVQALGDKITAYIARYTRELFTAAEVLTQFPYYPTDPARRKPLLEFAKALADLAQALLDPASPIVQIYEWARDAKNSAAKDKVGAEVAAKVAQKGQAEIKKRVADGDRLAAEANAEYADFEQAYLCSPSGVQQRLLNWMTDGLNADSHTKGLRADALHQHLFERAPDEIRALHRDLEKKIHDWNLGRGQNAESAQALSDLAAQLNRRIDAYVAQIATVSRVLHDQPPGGPLPAGVAAAQERVAHLMAQHVHALSYPQGFLEQARALAGQVQDNADRFVREFAESSEPVDSGVMTEVIAAEDVSADTAASNSRNVDQWTSDARSAYSNFTLLCLKPESGTTSLRPDQIRLRDEIARRLKKIPLSLGTVTNLFSLPESLKLQAEALQRAVDALDAPGVDVNRQLNRVRDAASSLNGAINTYLKQLEDVGTLLASDLQIGELEPTLDKARIRAGNLMVQLAFLQRQPASEPMQIQAVARRVGESAQRRLDALQGRMMDEGAAQHLDDPLTSIDVGGVPAVPNHTQDVTLGKGSPWTEGRKSENDRLLTTPIRLPRRIGTRSPASLATQTDTNASDNRPSQMDRVNVSLATRPVQASGEQPVDAPPSSTVNLDQELLDRYSDDSDVMLRGQRVPTHMNVGPQIDSEDEDHSPVSSVQQQRVLRRQNASVNLRGPRPTGPAAVQVEALADGEPFGEDDDLLLDLRIARGDPTVPAHEIDRQQRELQQLTQGLKKPKRFWNR